MKQWRSLDKAVPDEDFALGRRRQRRDCWPIGGLAVVYLIAGKLGLSMAFVHPSSTAVWPPTGIALAALLIAWVPRLARGVCRRILGQRDDGGDDPDVAWDRDRKHARGADRRVPGHAIRKRAECVRPRARHFQVCRCLQAPVGTAVAATFGVTSLALGGFAPWANYQRHLADLVARRRRGRRSS